MKFADLAALDLSSSFPKALAEEVAIVQASLSNTYRVSGEFTVNLSTEAVTIPHRLYGNQPITTPLSPTQQAIFFCLLTRHHNGRVRHSVLEPLLGQREEWICPFVWALLGDYVFEIVQLIQENLERLDRGLYAEFLARNPKFRELIKQRAISYWNCHYSQWRRIPFTQSPAHEVLVRFEPTAGRTLA